MEDKTYLPKPIMKIVCQGKNNRESGFTLIELLLVVVIVGILGAISAPSWLSFLTRQRMSAVNSDLVNVLKEAQSDAIQQRSPRQVTLSAVGSSPEVTVSYLDVSSATTTSAGSTTSLYTQSLGKDADTLQLAAFEYDSVTSSWSTAATAEINFDHKGNVSRPGDLPYLIKVQPQGANATSSKQCVIVTTILGGIKTERGDICDTFTPD